MPAQNSEYFFISNCADNVHTIFNLTPHNHPPTFPPIPTDHTEAKLISFHLPLLFWQFTNNLHIFITFLSFYVVSVCKKGCSIGKLKVHRAEHTTPCMLCVLPQHAFTRNSRRLTAGERKTKIGSVA